MINEIEVKKYCKEDISKIKNYDKAIADTTQTWHCHHILGEILSKEQLEAHDFYYNVPACMLKFVTKSEHRSLHNIHQSKETRKKISESIKGKTTTIFGKAFKEHYGITRCVDIKLYNKEYKFYKYYGHFSWEVK